MGRQGGREEIIIRSCVCVCLFCSVPISFCLTEFSGYLLVEYTLYLELCLGVRSKIDLDVYVLSIYSIYLYRDSLKFV